MMTAPARTATSHEPTVFVTHKFHFAAAHRLYNPALTEDENVAVFGKCANPGGHGHNYELFITLAGVPDARAGWVLDRERFAAIVTAHVLDALDHRNLNDVLDVEVTTSENLAVAVWAMLAGRFAPARLARVRVVETAKNSFDYYGPSHASPNQASPAGDDTRAHTPTGGVS